MNLHLQNKVILLTDNGEFLVSLVARQLENEGAIICRIPLIDAALCAETVRDAMKLHGRMDGLVNMLSSNSEPSLEHGDYRSFLQSLEQSVVYAFAVTQAALPWLRTSSGSIVNLIASGHSIANGGRIGLTAAWAEELHGQGIRVNGVVLSNAPDKLAEAVVFLLSRAAIGLQGELLHVDGGYAHLDRSIEIST